MRLILVLALFFVIVATVAVLGNPIEGAETDVEIPAEDSEDPDGSRKAKWCIGWWFYCSG